MRVRGLRAAAGAPDWTSGGKQAHIERWNGPSCRTRHRRRGDTGRRGGLVGAGATRSDAAAARARHHHRRRGPLRLIVSMARFNTCSRPSTTPRCAGSCSRALRQEDYMRAITGRHQTWQRVPGDVPLRAPDVTAPGSRRAAADRTGPVRAAMQGRRLQRRDGGDHQSHRLPIDRPARAGHRRFVERLGIKVDLQEMDWGSVLQRRPRGAGGEGRLEHLPYNWPSVSIANPAMQCHIRGQGDTGWTGWYGSPEMERLLANGSTPPRRRTASG